MKIKINCAEYKTAPLVSLRPIQGKLKNLSDKNFEKLKQQILDEGFISPFFIWIKDDERWILDGHQRHSVLMKMKEQGIQMPDDFPVYEIYAETYREACKRVLALSSQYGTINKQGLFDFIEDLGDFKEELDSFTFDSFDMESFKFDFYRDGAIGENGDVVDKVNRGDENSEWSDMPEFKEGGNYIKLIFHFKSEEEREKYCNENCIDPTMKKSNQWIVHVD